MKPFRRWLKNTATFYQLWLGSHEEDLSALKSGRPPVILLCGWGGTRKTMALLEERLAHDGFAPFVFPLGGLFGHFNTRRVDHLASRLVGHLASLSMTLSLPRMAIVGHSIGGLIGRHLVCFEGGARYAHTLVTLGSPHRGSPLAKTAHLTPIRWISEGIHQVIPGSELLRDLEARPIPPDVYCAALYSQGDHYCPPAFAQVPVPPGADNVVNIDVGNVGHVEYVIEEGVYEIIRDQLRIGLARAAT